MVLSDVTIKRLIAEGRIGIDPYDDSLLQPSSVDVRVDRYFRVFHNARYPFIDVKQPQEELTEEVAIDGDRPFILHPGEFVLGSTLERVTPAGRSRRPTRGQVLPRPPGASDPFDRRLHRPGLGRSRDARAVERREPPDHDLPRDEDRPDLVHAAHRADVDAVRQLVPRVEVPGAARADAVALLAELRVVKILVTGATGFVGPKIVHALRAQDYDVRALVRAPARGARLAGWGAELVTGDITDPASLRAALDGCTHVVHLVAMIKGSAADFHRVMTEGTEHLVAAAKDGGVERFVLMSALGTSATSKDEVPYYAAKWAEEQAVKGSGLEYTIFRPSFVFGSDGGALPTFMKQVRYSPVVTVIGSGPQRSQPIWVDDVAAYFARAIDRRAPRRTGRSRSAGRTSSTGTSST